jgi:RNA-directed DNA polymerase
MPSLARSAIKLSEMAKTHKHLYPQITAFDNLYEAWRKARRGKRYKPAAAAFEHHLDDELITLHDELQAESWQPGGYRSFTVHEPKRRKISAAPFRDRVVHHALVSVIEPIYERKFIFDSYANRQGKGTHAALDRCTHFMRRYPYVLQCDVQQFFPAIDHAVLKQTLAKTIACKPTQRLCCKIIDSGIGVLAEEYNMRWFPSDDLLAAARPRGLPIGNLTSQFWANVYLNELDQFVKHTLRCKGYVRYVDDFLLFAEDKHILHQWRDRIIRFLHSLRLTIHENRAQPRPVTQGIPFLGFTVYPDHRRLKRSKGIAYRRHLKMLYGRYQAGEITREDGRSSVMAWLGHVQHGDTWGLRRTMFREIS